MGKVTHIFYMDDLKLFVRDREELGPVVETTEYAAQAVGMEFGALGRPRQAGESRRERRSGNPLE